MKLLLMCLIVSSSVAYSIERIEVRGARISQMEFQDLMDDGGLTVARALNRKVVVGRRTDAPDPIPSEPEKLAEIEKEKKEELSEESFVYLLDKFITESFVSLRDFFDKGIVSNTKTVTRVYDANGNLVKENEIHNCISVAASSACTKMEIEHSNGTLIIKFQPLVTYYMAGLPILGGFTREAHYILIDHETGEYIEQMQYDITGEHIDMKYPCVYPEGTYEHGDRISKSIANGTEHLQCKYATLATTRIDCNSGYETLNHKTCTPKRCDGSLHGTRLLDSESACRSGRKQLTYKTCNLGNWDFSYSSTSCTNEEVPGPIGGGGGCSSPLGCIDPES